MNNQQTRYQVQKIFCETEDFNIGTEASSLVRIVIIPANKKKTITKNFVASLELLLQRSLCVIL